ncbi:MAG: permease-like cell division protein FtsX [bacterium]
MKRTAKDPWRGTSWQPVAWFRDHARIGSESINFISTRIGTSFLVWLVVGIALALPAGLWILQINMETMSAGWEGRPGLSVYFMTDASQEDIDVVAQALARNSDIAGVTLTTADEALAQFKQYSGLGDALDLLGENPLPASLTARFSDKIDPLALDDLLAALSQLAGVAEVVVEKTWLERLNDLSAVVSRMGLVLAIMFGVGAVLVTASSVRLAIESRLDELRVLKMVGATQGQIRRPFLYFGAIYGFGGGVIAAMLIAFTLVVIEPPLQSLLGSYRQELQLAGFNMLFLLLILTVGCVLGVLGALLAVRQRLRHLELF